MLDVEAAPCLCSSSRSKGADAMLSANGTFATSLAVKKPSPSHSSDGDGDGDGNRGIQERQSYLHPEQVNETSLSKWTHTEAALEQKTQMVSDTTGGGDDGALVMMVMMVMGIFIAFTL